MVERKRAALSAAIGLITASRYDIDIPPAASEMQLSEGELFEAVTKVAGWLARHTSEGDLLLAQIGQYVGQIEGDSAAG